MKIRRRKKNLTNIWQPFLNLYKKQVPIRTEVQPMFHFHYTGNIVPKMPNLLKINVNTPLPTH